MKALCLLVYRQYMISQSPSSVKRSISYFSRIRQPGELIIYYTMHKRRPPTEMFLKRRFRFLYFDDQAAFRTKKMSV